MFASIKHLAFNLCAIAAASIELAIFVGLALLLLSQYDPFN